MTSDGFFWVNLLCALSAIILLIRLWRRTRWLFVKPSMIILALSILLFQLPLLVASDIVFGMLPFPAEVAVLVHGFVLGGLVLAPLAFRQAAYDTWTGYLDRGQAGVGIWPLAVTAAALTLAYLAYVPFSQTGLYSLLTGQDPESFAMAREQSVKLVAAAVPRYALMLLASTVGPILSGVVALELAETWHGTRWPHRIGRLTLLVLVWAASMMSGAKGILVFQLMSAFIAFGLYRGLRVSLGGFAVALTVILLPAILITVLLSSPEADAATNSSGALQATVARALIVPFMVDIWYVDFAQQGGGPAGIAALRPLAVLFDITYFDLPNHIGLTYAPGYYGHEVTESISATGGYLFYFYAVFGLGSLPLSLVLLVLTDAVLILTRRIPGTFGIAVTSAMLVAAQKFVQSDYTTVWVTHGFGIVPVIGLLMVSLRSQPVVIARPAHR